jgi:cell division GTPase FtsZ
VNILLLSSGGGGGNILRSLKALFRRDLLVTQKTDARYAERLRRAITTKFLDTNEFSLNDLPKEERLVIGAATTRRMGSMHNPDVARKALDESREEVASLLNRHSVVIVIGTGGKGTGAGTIFPIAQMARQQKKLVIPIFVRPSFERHEVEKRRYDHALHVAEQFDAAGIRLMEILNDRGYRDTDPEPQPVVWERMNLPIARGLRGLLYVLWDLSQVDPSDLSVLFAGQGRLRMGFSELDPQNGQEPTDDQIRAAVEACWENPYAAFDGTVGTSLICIQGHWSNVVDGKIKGQLAALAHRNGGDSPYNPLHARAVHGPRPWGVTTLFAEYTGNHAPLEIDWSAERRVAVPLNTRLDADETVPEIAEEPVMAKASAQSPAADVRPAAPAAPPTSSVSAPAFSTFWDFARAVNRSDPAALQLAADGVNADITIDGRELRKLLGTFWFRSVFPRLSPQWRDRMLTVLCDGAVVADHPIAIGRRTVRLREMTPDERQRMLSDPSLADEVRSDLQLVDAVARHWGDEAVKRLTFTPAAAMPPTVETSKLGALLQPFRHG